MGRIHFIFLSSLFLLITLILISVTSFNQQLFHYKASAQNSNLSSYDVIIVGGGSGGVTAAIQAARLGATVAIIEETDWLGGQITSANVSTMDESPVDDRFGIYKEFIGEAKRLYGNKPVSTCYGGGPEANCFEPHIAKQAIDNLIINTRQQNNSIIDIYYRTKITNVVKNGNTITGVVLSNGITKNSKVLIDATEWGDVIPKTGSTYRLGKKLFKNEIEIGSANPTSNAPSCIQDITYTAVIRKFGNPTYKPLSEKINIPKPPNYGVNNEPQLEFSKMVALESLSGSRFPWTWVNHNKYRGLPDSYNPINYRAPESPNDINSITKTAVNFANDYSMYAPYNYSNQLPIKNLSNIFLNEPSDNQRLSIDIVNDPNKRKVAVCEAKKKTWAFLYYMQNELQQSSWSLSKDEGYCSSDQCYVLKDENCTDVPDEIEKYLPSTVYTRESRRIDGLVTLTAKDISDANRNKNKFISAIAVGDYPTDLHNCYWDSYLETDLENFNDISNSGAFQIPLEALIPKDINGFLVAEKNISQTRLVNGATRLQPVTMNTGQAVGVLAALSAKHNLISKNIQPRQVQAILAQSGSRLNATAIPGIIETNPLRKAAEFVVATKLLVGNAQGELSFDRVITRAEVGVILLRVNSIQATSYTQRFTDVPSTHWAFAALNTLYENGLTAGCSSIGPKYCPENPITREELASFLTRLDPKTNPMTLVSATAYSFTDVATNRPTVLQINTAVKLGLMKACDVQGLKFCPEQQVTRGEFADALLQYFVYRAINKPQ